eukprot:GGOE01005129.1.p4 GENE.GGOE01005129.1~~GGOE01005129.1.p4  ORF type:complete len:148 (+),score=6.64 GGOE01005129.1:318-761(+)
MILEDKHMRQPLHVTRHFFLHSFFPHPDPQPKPCSFDVVVNPPHCPDAFSNTKQCVPLRPHALRMGGMSTSTTLNPPENGTVAVRHFLLPPTPSFLPGGAAVPIHALAQMFLSSQALLRLVHDIYLFRWRPYVRQRKRERTRPRRGS